MERKLKVFLVDDHTIVRQGIASLISIQADMDVIGQAGDGETALQEVQHCLPDIIVMDVSMPHMNGVEATVHIRKACPTTAVVALTRHSDAGYARQMIQAGARAYVLKQAAANDLVSAIRVVAGGGVYLDPTVAGRLVDIGGHQSISGAAHGQELSEREAEVVRLIAYGYSNKEIAAQLDLSVKTIDTYKVRAMEKLHLSSRMALVRYALEQGWLGPD